MIQQQPWRSIPVLPCVSIEETLSFWESMGFRITYKQTRPYQYGAVARDGSELHFTRIKGMETGTNWYNGCLVMVGDAQGLYKEMTIRLKQLFGKVSNSGIPRISRMKPGATRFTLTDVSGNSIIFISFGEADQEAYNKTNNKEQSPLQRAIAASVRFRDYKEDEKAAAAVLDVALTKIVSEQAIDIAEALIIRIDLAVFMNDAERVVECKSLLNKMELSDGLVRQLAEKHNVVLK